MLHKTIKIIKALTVYAIAGEGKVSAGMLSKYTGFSYSTVRRVLENAREKGFVTQDVVPYKTTGKIVFFTTQKGHELMISQLEMF